MKVLPFTDENLRLALPAARKPAAECSICSVIGGQVSRLEKGGVVESNTLPEAIDKLREFMRLGENVATNWLELCPECDALYYAERSSEYLAGGSEDYESHQAISHDGVLELAEVSWARTPAAELHGFADGTWAIIVEPQNRLPQRRT